MNPQSSRKNYGILPLSAALTRGVQLEWAMVESPAAQSRFLNFPLADEISPQKPLQPTHRARQEKRPLAA